MRQTEIFVQTGIAHITLPNELFPYHSTLIERERGDQLVLYEAVVKELVVLPRVFLESHYLLSKTVAICFPCNTYFTNYPTYYICQAYFLTQCPILRQYLKVN